MHLELDLELKDKVSEGVRVFLRSHSDQQVVIHNWIFLLNRN